MSNTQQESERRFQEWIKSAELPERYDPPSRAVIECFKLSWDAQESYWQKRYSELLEEVKRYREVFEAQAKLGMPVIFVNKKEDE